MKNYKLIFAYDGSRYKGWQKLGLGEKTIQGTIENAIGSLIGRKVEIHGSGRTDAGVHANGQVVNMKVQKAVPQSFLEELNCKLPEDIRLLQIEQVSETFHARYSAVEKTYRYQVDLREKSNVFTRKYFCHFPQTLQVANMRKAAAYLIGTHDFSSFTDDKTSNKSKVRTVYEIQIFEKENEILFLYRGDGFLQHMVRILTGTLLEVGTGKRIPEEIKQILQKKERAAAGFMAPAKGLFLETVKYDIGG